MGLLSRAGWSVVKQSIRTGFPRVQQISPAVLAERLDQPNLKLFDVRSEAEYAVSHLLTAQRIDPQAQDLTLNELPKETPIVTYCSVGFRSSRFADRPQGAGFTNVANLEGSIFQWANEQRPVYQGERRVWQVHPYSAFWSRLLNANLQAYESLFEPSSEPPSEPP